MLHATEHFQDCELLHCCVVIGQPVVNLEEPLATPTKGYVLQASPAAERLWKCWISLDLQVDSSGMKSQDWLMISLNARQSWLLIHWSLVCFFFKIYTLHMGDLFYKIYTWDRKRCFIVCFPWRNSPFCFKLYICTHTTDRDMISVVNSQF